MPRTIFFLAVFLSFALYCQGGEPKYELRGVWLTTNHALDWPSAYATGSYSREQQKAELCEILDRLQEANFNTLFFQVRARGDAFYASSTEPWSVFLMGEYGKNPGYDPLAFAIEECRKRGMECHAWIVTLPLGKAEQVKQMGFRSVVKQRPELCKLFRGEWYLDPGEPATAEYLRMIVGEIVRDYDIDGIHFDYIRYPENAQNFPDTRAHKKYGRRLPLAEWREANITHIQETLYDEVKRLKPNVLVSVSPLGKYQRLPEYPEIKWTGIESVHQDAGKWMRERKCDFVAPMMYYLHEHFFPFLDDWVNSCGAGGVVPGLGIYRLEESPEWRVNDITDQIDYGRFHGAKGNVFFRCKNLFSNSELYQILKEEYYRYPALFPVAPVTDQTVTPPTDVSARHADSAIVFEWEDRSGVPEPIYLLYRVNGGQPQLIARSVGKTTLSLAADSLPDTSDYYLTIYTRDRKESRPSQPIRIDK